jgi:hypothetical protein
MALWGNSDNVSVKAGATVSLNYATKWSGLSSPVLLELVVH